MGGWGPRGWHRNHLRPKLVSGQRSVPDVWLVGRGTEGGLEVMSSNGGVTC